MADTRAYLALGGNVGDVASAFRAAFDALRETPGVRVTKTSPVYRTPPWGVTDQPDFLNMAAEIETSLDAHELLELCLSIERASGRVREMRWGPRNIDIDVIAYGDTEISDARLTVPHPHAHERAFVLAPLADIAPALQIRGRRVSDWLAEIDTSGLHRL